MPPITRSGARRGERGGNANVQPQVQAAPAPIQAALVPVVQHQQNVQAMVVPPPAVPVIAPPAVDQVGVHLIYVHNFKVIIAYEFKA